MSASAPIVCVATCLATSLAVADHRGAPAELPESTLAGFARALEATPMIELDVRATRDGALVVHHDARVSPRCEGPPGARGARIRDLTLAELRGLDCGARDPAFPRQGALPGAQVATLDDVLALAAMQRAGGASVLVELKADDAPAPDELASLVVAALDRARARGLVVVESFDPAYVAALRVRAPDVARGLLCGTCDAATLDAARALGARLVSPAHDRLDGRFVAAAHAQGLGVVAWTANDAPSWRRLAALGVDGIVTDDPRALAAALR